MTKPRALAACQPAYQPVPLPQTSPGFEDGVAHDLPLDPLAYYGRHQSSIHVCAIPYFQRHIQHKELISVALLTGLASLHSSLLGLALWQGLFPFQAGAAESVSLDFLQSWLVRGASQ